MLNTALAILLILLAGCTTISANAPPADWPQLQIHVHETSYSEVQRICKSHPAVQTLACAGFDFEKGYCVIVTSSKEQWVLDHEKRHCAGWDDSGSSELASLWEKHKSGN